MDMKFNYHLTYKDGRKVGVYNHNNDGRRTVEYHGPFADQAEAIKESEEWTDAWQYGYSGRSNPVEVDGKWYIRCDRWNSCD